MAKRVEVVAHSAEWREMFEAEAAAIRAALGGEARGIHHIGSTAIPGVSAKPIIDILLEVRDIGRMDELTPRMTALGYEAWGEYGIPGRRYFVKFGEAGGGAGFIGRTHHVHAYQVGNPEIERHLAFRDYMISHPTEAREYSRLKEDLAWKAGDIEAYMDGKDAFVKATEKRALAWRRSRA